MTDSGYRSRSPTEMEAWTEKSRCFTGVVVIASVASTHRLQADILAVMPNKSIAVILNARRDTLQTTMCYFSDHS